MTRFIGLDVSQKLTAICVVSNDIGIAPLGDMNSPPSFPHARFACGSASGPGLSSPERRFSRSR